MKGTFWIHADRVRLHQILSNLIDNAIKFSHASGDLDILITEKNIIAFENKERGMNPLIEDTPTKKDYGTREPTEIYVAISDRGTGISPRMLPYLFNKFITDSDYGTGLGLYITKILVEMHGGKIWAYNNKDGLGSTFVVGLPIFDDRPVSI